MFDQQSKKIVLPFFLIWIITDKTFSEHFQDILKTPLMQLVLSGFVYLFCRKRITLSLSIMDPEGGAGSWDPPEKLQKCRVYYQYWSVYPENNKATNSAFNVWPSFAGGTMLGHRLLAKRCWAIVCWRNDDVPFIAVFASTIPFSNKKNAPLNNFLDLRMIIIL